MSLACAHAAFPSVAGANAGRVAGVAVTPDADSIRARAGGVVTRVPSAADAELLVVHRPRYDDWSLPKGKVEPGETDEDAARREVEEETGYLCTLGDELTTVRYIDRKGRNKQVRFWKMTVTGERVGAERRGRRTPLDIAGGCRDTAHLRSRSPALRNVG